MCVCVTDRQTDRQTETDRKRERQRHRDKKRETDSQTDRDRVDFAPVATQPLSGFNSGQETTREQASRTPSIMNETKTTATAASC